MKGEDGFKSLKVYQIAFDLAMRIFELSKSFPKEERYSLTDQIRRSSRSVCSNIAEGYRKRIYPKHFIAKMSDADGECSETIVWLDFAKACHYLPNGTCADLVNTYQEVGRMLGGMVRSPEKFAIAKSSNGSNK